MHRKDSNHSWSFADGSQSQKIFDKQSTHLQGKCSCSNGDNCCATKNRLRQKFITSRNIRIRKILRLRAPHVISGEGSTSPQNKGGNTSARKKPKLYGIPRNSKICLGHAKLQSRKKMRSPAAIERNSIQHGPILRNLLCLSGICHSSP